MIGLDGKRAIVKRLVVHGAGLDPVAARLSAEVLLASAEVHPPSLSPSAILVIRRLLDPRPGAISLDRAGLFPPRAWSDALAASLDAMVRRAARPANGPVSAAADAVLFSDRSDLLACLAIDFLRGEVGARWWWSSLLPDSSAARAAITAWIAAPEHVPGALHLLAERREAAHFAQALAPSEIADLARSMADRCGVPGLPAWIAPRTARAAPKSPMRVTAHREIAPEPWDPWAPEARSIDLDFEPRALLGIGLALHRAPSVVRSITFAEAVGRYGEPTPSEATPRAPNMDPSAGEGSTNKTEPRAPSPRGHELPQSPPIARARMTHEIPVVAAQTPEPAPLQSPAPLEIHTNPVVLTGPRLSDSPSSEPDLPGPIRLPAPPSPALAAHPSPLAAEAGVAPAKPSPLDDNNTPIHKTPAPVEIALLAPPTPLAEPAPPIASPPLAAPPHKNLAERPPRIFSAPIATRFGGLFFLVNLGIYLDLYGDFTTPLSPGIDLPIWDFVALVGLDLAGPEVLHDPIWPLLAHLAGRGEGEPPGHTFRPPLVFEPPPSWIRPSRGSIPLPSPEIPPGATPLERWLGHVLPYARARLALALPIENWARVLCAIPARVHVSTTHLDVVISLADLPILVRLAGLDRDPGWVPAAGRYMAFHFVMS